MTIDISKIRLENLIEYQNGKIRKCVICGKEFKANRRKQATCSQKCNSRNNYKKRSVSNMIVESFESDLKEGHAVAFDFDGVIHKYSKGWQDGSIYDEYNKEVLDLMLLLTRLKIPVFILSTREPQQIIEWWNEQKFSIKAMSINEETKFWDNLNCIGVTNKKLPAQLYVDDRAYCYKGQTVKQFLLDSKKGV